MDQDPTPQSEALINDPFKKFDSIISRNLRVGISWDQDKVYQATSLSNPVVGKISFRAISLDPEVKKSTCI